LILVPVIVGIGLFFLMARLKQPPKQKETVSRAPVVRVMKITPMQVLPRAYGYGTTEPIRVWKAIAQVSGKIVYSAPDLKKGTTVRKDAVLLQIDPTEFNITISQLQARIESLRTQLNELEVQRKNSLELLKIHQQTLDIKEKETSRQKQLFEKKVIAANAYESQLQNLMAQQAQVQSIRNSLNLIPHQRDQLQAQIRQAEGDLANARLQLSYTVIKAPFDVQIASVNNESSEFVQRGQTVFTANDISAVEIEAQFIPGSARPVFMSVREGLDEADRKMPSAASQLGITAIARLPSDRFGKHWWKAELSRFSDSMDAETRTMGLIFTIRNSFDRQPGSSRNPPLFKGWYCQVELRGKIIENALVIPRHALHPGNIVYLLTQEKTLEKREVTPGPAIDDFVVIEGNLKPGERLVLSDIIPAVTGMKLNPVADDATLKKLIRDAMGEAL